ncbi:hypothetical protein JXL21_12095 [Candidatus Bathyarchaeota archaeon]|nr:hypothetical protein [Candidatus Bathyarchaeota archaeon]
MNDSNTRSILKTTVVAVFILSSVLLNLQLLQTDKCGLVEANQEQGVVYGAVEGRVIELKPDSYLPFLVEFNMDSQPAQAWCKASARAEELYREGAFEENRTMVLAAIDIESMTGVVIDAVVNDPLEEPASPSEEPQAPEEPEPEPEPQPEPEPCVDLPQGFELVSMEPGPTPGIIAPDGMVKLTVMTQPFDVPGVTVYPPPGVYFVAKNTIVTFKCVSGDEDWEFSNWTLSQGILGVRRKPGIGYEHLLRWRGDVDTVVTAYHSEVV